MGRDWLRWDCLEAPLSPPPPPPPLSLRRGGEGREAPREGGGVFQPWHPGTLRGVSAPWHPPMWGVESLSRAPECTERLPRTKSTPPSPPLLFLIPFFPSYAKNQATSGVVLPLVDLVPCPFPILSSSSSPPPSPPNRIGVATRSDLTLGRIFVQAFRTALCPKDVLPQILT